MTLRKITHSTRATSVPAVRATLDRSAPEPAIALGIGGDVTVPLSLDAAVAHASRVLALVMEARQQGGAAA